MALGLGLMAQEAAPGFGVHAAEAFAEVEGAIVGQLTGLSGGGLGELPAHTRQVVPVGRNDLVEHAGEEAAFQVGGAQAGLLGDGDLLNGEEFLGIAGLVEGDEIGAEGDNPVHVFEAWDIVVVHVEAMFAGVPGGAGLPFGGARAGGASGIGAVGGELLFGDGRGCVRQAVALQTPDYHGDLRPGMGGIGK